MKHFSIELNAHSPLAIRSDHASGGAETAKFISGTTLAGSLAAVHRLLHSRETSEFEALFLSGKVSYPNLYPALFKDDRVHALDFPVYPLPRTAQSCKRFSGFQYMAVDEIKKGEEKRHGVRDGLFDWALFNLSREVDRETVATLDILKRHKLCLYDIANNPQAPQYCNESMDHFGGYYCRDDREEIAFLSAQVDGHTRLQTRTGIDRTSGTVHEGILYNRQVFDDGMRFWGLVAVNDDGDERTVSQLQGFLEEVGDTGLVRIGTGRTRGLGNVSLRVKPAGEQDKLNMFQSRLIAFHEVLRREAEKVGLKESLKPFYFALTLHSPLIVCDDLLRYRGTIDEDMLEQLTGLSSSMFKAVYQCASTRRVTGWNELWGTPRTNEYAIETGSVFLFACSQDLDDTLVQSLFKLEEQGIGRRRTEGFGRVCVSDPFHLEVELR